MPIYDNNVIQEMYSVILRISKCGYLRGANKGSPKIPFFSGLAKRRWGDGLIGGSEHGRERRGGEGVLRAVTNKNCVVIDGRGLGWSGGCEHGGEERVRFPEKVMSHYE